MCPCWTSVIGRSILIRSWMSISIARRTRERWVMRVMKVNLMVRVMLKIIRSKKYCKIDRRLPNREIMMPVGQFVKVKILLRGRNCRPLKIIQCV